MNNEMNNKDCVVFTESYSDEELLYVYNMTNNDSEVFYDLSDDDLQEVANKSAA